MTSNQMTIEKTWVAYGPAGVVGTVHKTDVGYTFRLLTDEVSRADFPSLGVAQSALHAALLPGAEWPEFREH